MTIYRGFSGVNREIKQQYRSLAGVNREIKEQYRGLEGTNRMVYQAGVPYAKYSINERYTYYVYDSGTTHSYGAGTVSIGNAQPHAGGINIAVTHSIKIGVTVKTSAMDGKYYLYNSRCYRITSFTLGSGSKITAINGIGQSKGTNVVREKGTFIENVMAPDGSLPIDGEHTDGYWYVKL